MFGRKSAFLYVSPAFCKFFFAGTKKMPKNFRGLFVACGGLGDYNFAMPENKKRRSLRRRLLKLAIFLVYVLVIAEIGSRVYWKIKRDIPFFTTPNDWYSRFYEELKESDVLNADLGPDNGTFDVLLLGG
ncbi:MAG: hypothetical protein DRP83_06745, partial [Planctomycetota bacterium]